MALLVLSAHQCQSDSDAITKNEVKVTLEETPSNTSARMTFEEASEVTRNTLIPHCGSCHQSTLTTHKPGAIAVFDLDLGPQWHQDLSEENLPGIDDRTKNKSTITDSQREALATFLELKESLLKE